MLHSNRSTFILIGKNVLVYILLTVCTTWSRLFVVFSMCSGRCCREITHSASCTQSGRHSPCRCVPVTLRHGCTRGNAGDTVYSTPPSLYPTPTFHSISPKTNFAYFASSNYYDSLCDCLFNWNYLLVIIDQRWRRWMFDSHWRHSLFNCLLTYFLTHWFLPV